jgi:hypothetical protein
MAVLSITAANVKKVAGSTVTDEGIAGVTITAGQALYKNLTNAAKLALADADTEATSIFEGIALHAALADQPIEYATAGLIDIGATVTVGEFYTIHTTEGGIGPYADLASGDYPSAVGFGVTTGRIEIRRNNSRVAKA